MGKKNADGMANSVDPDQTAILGAVWSGSTLFAQTCLSENVGISRYAPLKKSEWNLVSKIWARGVKLGQLTGVYE